MRKLEEQWWNNNNLEEAKCPVWRNRPSSLSSKVPFLVTRQYRVQLDLTES